MNYGPRLDLRQSQSLVMTPQLQQAIKLLALSNMEIETFISEALDSNPLLDVGQAERSADADAADVPEEARKTTLEKSPVDQLIGEGRVAEDKPLDTASATSQNRDPDTGDGELAGLWGSSFSGGEGPEGPSIEERGDTNESLADHLEAQIGSMAYSAGEAAIARFIVGQLDEAGYLTVPIADVATELAVTLDEAEDALVLVQSLEPTGVGATSLSECIALQAQEADRYDPAMARLIDNLDLVGRGEFARLKRMCGVDDADMRDMLAELRSYDPKPGLRFGDDVAAAVVPDVLLSTLDDGGWDIRINQATLPKLIVNRDYYMEVRGSCQSRDSRSWLSEKLSDAKWLIKALDQRQKTILKVAAEVVKQQDGFFRYGVAQLKPLTMRAVAEAIGMHESTVSRVTSNKYLQCDRGTFELKYFFSSGVAASGGEGAASAEAVKAAIRKLIDAEDPKAILSDDKLVDLLKEQGFELARRTVAKYREAIGLGSSVQRRRQKAMSAAG